MSTTPPAPLSTKRSDLKSALAQVSLRDESRLRRKLDRARTPDALVALAEEIETARTRLAARSANVPAVSYPEALPVSQRKDDIATAISENQVVIVAGETGSGKTTQIPKICLELGRGVRGLIDTHSRAGWQHAPLPNVSPKNLTPNSATPSDTPCGSPTRSRTAPTSSS